MVINMKHLQMSPLSSLRTTRGMQFVTAVAEIFLQEKGSFIANVMRTTAANACMTINNWTLRIKISTSLETTPQKVSSHCLTTLKDLRLRRLPIYGTQSLSSLWATSLSCRNAWQGIYGMNIKTLKSQDNSHSGNAFSRVFKCAMKRWELWLFHLLVTRSSQNSFKKLFSSFMVTTDIKQTSTLTQSKRIKNMWGSKGKWLWVWGPLSEETLKATRLVLDLLISKDLKYWGKSKLLVYFYRWMVISKANLLVSKSSLLREINQVWS